MSIEVLSYVFMQKAFIGGIVIALATALLGVFLVLRKYALIGDGLAHISFGGIALGLLARIMPFISAMLFGIVAALGIIKLKEHARLHGDASIGIISHASLGIGIFIASLAHGFTTDIMSYLFGNILAINTWEVVTSVVVSAIVVYFVVHYYRDLFYLTFDEASAKTSGVKVEMLNTLLIVLTAVTIVSAMRVVGLLLAASMIILPAASALQVSNSFKKALITASIISVASVIVGITLAYYYDFATSGTIVLVNATAFLGLLLLRKGRTARSRHM